MRAAPFSTDEVSMLMQRYGPVRGVRQLRDLFRWSIRRCVAEGELAATPVDRQRLSDS